MRGCIRVDVLEGGREGVEGPVSFSSRLVLWAKRM